MTENETKINEERIKNSNDRTLLLIRDIMSEFTEVVKMLTETMGAQLNIIKEQEKNNIETTRLNNQAINRQLDIIENQNGFLKNFFDKIEDKDAKKIIDIWEKRRHQM